MINGTGNSLPELRAYSKICSDAADLLTEKYIKPMEKSVGKIKKNLQEIDSLLGREDNQEPTDSMRQMGVKKLENVMREIEKDSCYYSYFLMKIYADHPFTRHIPEQNFGENSTENSAENIVKAFVKNGSIFLKLARLPHRNNSVYTGKFGTIQAKRAGEIQSQDIVSAMLELPELDMETGNVFYRSFTLKQIYFLHVLDKNTNSRDNDNYEITGALNSICSVLPGGDCGCNCRLEAFSIYSDLLPEGTYVTITPLHKNRPEDPEILREWTEILSTRN